MPSPQSVNAQTTRRPSGSLRQRENRGHNTQAQSSAALVRRRKSRSPEARVKRPVTIAGTSSLPSSSSSVVVLRSSQEEFAERGRNKAKPKSRPQTLWVDGDDPSIVTNIVHNLDRAGGAQSERSKRKERSRSRSREVGTRLSRKATTPDISDEGDEPMYTGPLAHADYQRMKQEVEILRKQVAMSKKTINKQSKVIDELRSELTTTNESHRTQRTELDKLKRRTKKSEEFVATVESNLTCQICMELLLKPYGLSPCGHVLCMSCLLEWFKTAPAGEDDMLDDDYPDAVLFRKKTCPCCRAIVSTRPIPLYVVKSLASALDKTKAPAGAVRPSPPPDEGDPWAGIFRDPTDFADYWSTDEEDDNEEDDNEDMDDDDDNEDYDDEDGYWSLDGYGTGEDEEGYDGPYVPARWTPPFAHVSADDYPFLDADSEEFKMLRRGATLQMIELFQMSYAHDTGLTAVVEEGNIVYLGWNLELHPDDETGEEYMDWVLVDMYDRPERWRMIHDPLDGSWVAHKLAPRDEAEEPYDNTDSEMWTAESEDEDM